MADGAEVLADWRADGRIDGTYTVAEIREARTMASSSMLEYQTLDEELDRALGVAIEEAATTANAKEAPEKGTPWATIAALAAASVLAIAGAIVVVRRRRGRTAAPTAEGDEYNHPR